MASNNLQLACTVALLAYVVQLNSKLDSLSCKLAALGGTSETEVGVHRQLPPSPSLDAAACSASEGEHGAEVSDIKRTAAAVAGVVMLVVPTLLLLHPRDQPEPRWMWLLRRAFGSKSRNSLHYELDAYFAEAPNAKSVVLLVLTCFVTLAGTLGLVAVSGGSVYDEAWTTLAGIGLDWSFAGEHRSFTERCMALLVALGGMFITALLVGIVSDSISTKLDELREGNAQLHERGHMLVLGWSETTLPLIYNLAHAHPHGCTIVVLAEHPKDWMDDEVSHFLEHADAHTSNSEHEKRVPPRVLCRSGNLFFRKDLRRVSVNHAASVILVADTSDPAASDASALRCLITLNNLRHHEGMEGHVVVDATDADNAELMTTMGGRESTHLVAGLDAVGRIMLLSARCPGLSSVFDELLGFAGSEFHESAIETLNGKLFGSLLSGAFEDAVPVGIRRADGTVLLNPPADTTYEAGDKLIVLAEDDDSYAASTDEKAYALKDALSGTPPVQRALASEPEKVLFIGWRKKTMASMVANLDGLLRRGSQLVIMSTVPIADREELLADVVLERITLSHVVADQAVRADLEKLPLETFTSMLLLANESEDDDQVGSGSTLVTDSRTLAALMLVRDIQTERLKASGATLTAGEAALYDESAFSLACSRCEIVAEVLDSRTRPLIMESHAADCIMTSEIVAKVLAMIACDPHIGPVLGQLLSAEGNELAVRPAVQYLPPGSTSASFWQLADTARSRHELLLGWRLLEGGHNVMLNPTGKGESRVWREHDMLVVISKAAQTRREEVPGDSTLSALASFHHVTHRLSPAQKPVAQEKKGNERSPGSKIGRLFKRQSTFDGGHAV